MTAKQTPLRPSKLAASRKTPLHLSGICRYLTASLLTIVSLSFLFLVAGVGNAAQITLAWDPDQIPSLAGYRVYSGTHSRSYSESADTGTATTYTTPDLKDGTYYFAVTARDASGQESGYSNEVSVTIAAGAVTRTPSPSASQSSSTEGSAPGSTDPTGGSAASASGTGDSGSNSSPPAAAGDGGSGGGGGCFVATAAFGSYVDPHVMTLRAFRDSFLLTNRPGRAFVRWYYATSPAIADVIRERGLLKKAVRLALLPAIGFSYFCLRLGFLPTILLVLLSFPVMFYAVGRLGTSLFDRRRDARRHN